MKEKILKILSCERLLKYVSNGNGKYDLVFYLFFMAQTSILPSIPSGFHSQTSEGWLGFSITAIFSFIFYPAFYFAFYRSEETKFIREIAIFSVVARFSSFLLTGIIAISQIGLWSILRLEKIPSTSLVYYIFYYALFSFLMVLYKKRYEEIRKVSFKIAA